jgi:hypothetical protein
MSDGKGYLIPDPIDPVNMICIRVWVPDDRLYIAAFWGAYQFFTTWVAWAKDPLKRGREAAAVWRRAWDKSREFWELTKGVCFDMITGIRTNPLDGCKLQVQMDGGAWVDIFDASCCGGGDGCGHGALRYSGGAIQQYDSDTGEWHNIGPVTPPTETPVGDTPYPPSSDGACLAATNFGHLIEERKNILAEVVGGGLTFLGTILAAYDLILSYMSIGAFLSLVGDLVEAVYASVIANYVEVGLYDIEAEATCLALQFYANDGSMSQASIDAMVVAIDEKIATFDPDTELFKGTTWRYVKSWVIAAGPAGMADSAHLSGITEGACDDCPGVQLFDFTESSCFFTPGDHVPGGGAAYKGLYVPGHGWKMEPYVGPGGPGRILQIFRACMPTNVYMVRLEYEGTPGDGGGSQTISVGDELFHPTMAAPFLAGNQLVDNSADWTGGVSVTNAAIFASAATPSDPPEDYQIHVRKVWYFFHGPNGFETPLPPAP